MESCSLRCKHHCIFLKAKWLSDQKVGDLMSAESQQSKKFCTCLQKWTKTAQGRVLARKSDKGNLYLQFVTSSGQVVSTANISGKLTLVSILVVHSIVMHMLFTRAD